MFIYIVILFVLFLMGLFEVHGALNKRHHKLSFLLVIIAFWILSFIRWETGTDWDSYLRFFQSNYTLDEFNKSGMEPLFSFINYIVKSITNQYWVLLLVIGGLIYSLTSTTIYKYSPLPFVSLIVYLMLRKADIFFVRESIALAFCLFSLRYIIDRSFIRFVICIAIGMQFHRSIIVFLPAYFIFMAKWNYSKIIILLGLFSVLVIFLQQTILNYILQLAGSMGEVFLYKTENYTENDVDYGGGAAVISAVLPRALLNRSILLAMMLYANRKIKNNVLLRGTTNIYIASLIIYLITMPISVVLSRLANSYDIFCIIALAFFIKSISRKFRPIIYIAFYLYMAVRFVFGTLLGSYTEAFIPYKTIFF